MRNPFRLLSSKPASVKPRSLQRDSFELALPDGSMVVVERVRNPRAKRLRLSVDERGARLTLPPRASVRSAQDFVAAHVDWLAQQLSVYREDQLPNLRRDETSMLPLRGQQLPLRWEAGRFSSLQADASGELVFRLPTRAGGAAMCRALQDFYDSQARADVGRWLPAYLSGLPRAPRQIRFKRMSSQWGSLAPDGSMALDLSLVLARPAAFEYVLVHELCHLIHADHSHAFWGEVEARCPEWRLERDYLRENGRYLKAGLRQLLTG